MPQELAGERPIEAVPRHHPLHTQQNADRVEAHLTPRYTCIESPEMQQSHGSQLPHSTVRDLARDHYSYAYPYAEHYNGLVAHDARPTTNTLGRHGIPDLNWHVRQGTEQDPHRMPEQKFQPGRVEPWDPATKQFVPQTSLSGTFAGSERFGAGAGGWQGVIDHSRQFTPMTHVTPERVPPS